MTVKLNVEVQCDGECGSRTGQCRYRCSQATGATLHADGKVGVDLPSGWTSSFSPESHLVHVFGPNCNDQLAMAKALRAELPKPENDEPLIAKGREKRLEIMREVVKEDLAEDANKHDAFIALDGETPALDEMREFIEKKVVDSAEPDFVGSPEGTAGKIEVRVKGDYIEISWPDRPGLSLTLQHKRFILVDPPAFVDEDLIRYIQGCLATKRGGASSPSANPTVN